MDLTKYWIIEELIKQAKKIQDALPKGKTIYFVPEETDEDKKRRKENEST